MSRWWFYFLKISEDDILINTLSIQENDIKYLKACVPLHWDSVVSSFFLIRLLVLLLQLQWKVGKIWNIDLTLKRVKFSRFWRTSRNCTQLGRPRVTIMARYWGMMESSHWVYNNENLTRKRKKEISPPQKQHLNLSLLQKEVKNPEISGEEKIFEYACLQQSKNEGEGWRCRQRRQVYSVYIWV